MADTYIYVVDRDFGFAPNPFHGILTLATCKPRIRSAAQVGDWVIGVGGSRLKRGGHCIYGMRVTDTLTFEEYWHSADFQEKKPIRNGSKVSLVGDNIYSRAGGVWVQRDSHHSNPDGTPNMSNLTSDTSTNRVLVSDDFRYLGSASREIPTDIIRRIEYRNGRNHRRFDLTEAGLLVDWVAALPKNRVISDPCDFERAAARFEGQSRRVI